MSYPPQTAQQRAAQQLDQRFGDRARPQINQLQAQAALVGSGQQLQQRPPNAQLQPQRQQIGEQQRIMLEQQRRQQQQQQHYQQLQQAQQRSSINNAQTDGAGDWNAMVAQRRADALRNPNGMHEANLTIREQVEQASQAREGGGLMLPMSEHSKKPKSKKSGFVRSTAVSSLHSAQPTDFSHMPKIPQYDGGDESEEDDKTGIKDDPDPEPTPEPDLDLDDEDAINSDLDDPDDNVVEEGEDDGKEGEIMLCTYDKVQRVKNKWKCTLKDGVLTTGGREYVKLVTYLLYAKSANAKETTDMSFTKRRANSNGSHQISEPSRFQHFHASPSVPCRSGHAGRLPVFTNPLAFFTFLA